MTALLDISKLSLSFRTEKGKARVLDMIDLAVKPGEIVGLVGESGCGKTTLARAILGTLPDGLTEIGSGHIRLDGVDMLRGGKAAESVRGRVVTFVPQDPFASFNPLFRVGTQIADLMRYKAPRPTGGPGAAMRGLTRKRLSPCSTRCSCRSRAPSWQSIPTSSQAGSASAS